MAVANAHQLIFNRGQLGFAAIYRRCGLPQGLFEFVHTAVDVVHETKYDGGPADRDSVDYLINKLNYEAARAA